VDQYLIVPVLAHFTLDHWITYFTKFKGAVKQAFNYINQKDPVTGVFRKVAALGWVASAGGLDNDFKCLRCRISFGAFII